MPHASDYSVIPKKKKKKKLTTDRSTISNVISNPADMALKRLKGKNSD